MDKADKLTWTEWIKEQREKRGWTQQLLAEKVGATRQTINDYEQGRRLKNPDGMILAKISLVLGEADDFLSRLAGGLPPATNDQDEWLKSVNAKLRRVPPHNRDAVNRVIESFADDQIEPREIQRKPKK